MTAYLILTLGSLMFWSLYQMAPSGLMLFAVHNVDLMVGSVQIQPQWIQNINTVCIVVGGPLLAVLFTRMRARGWRIDIPQQFAVSLLLMALAFLILPLGIKLAGADGKSAFVWLFLSYVLQSIGELLIMPIGYAMIGKMAPKQYQGVMMGSWMLVTGLASLFAGDFSGMIPEPTGTTAVATNPGYVKLFAELGAGSLAVGVALVVLIPFLRKLITDKAEITPAEMAMATVVPVARGLRRGSRRPQLSCGGASGVRRKRQPCRLQFCCGDTAATTGMAGGRKKRTRFGRARANLWRYNQRRITQARIATTRDNPISTVATTEPACAG